MITRLAALAALAAVVAAMFVLVTSSSSGGSNSPGGSSTAPVVAKPSPARSRRHFWLVRNGQTLSEIATRTQVSTDAIKRLNPKADLTILHSGQQVRVRP